jgi:hypothetical protein
MEAPLVRLKGLCLGKMIIEIIVYGRKRRRVLFLEEK